MMALCLLMQGCDVSSVTCACVCCQLCVTVCVCVCVVLWVGDPPGAVGFCAPLCLWGSLTGKFMRTPGVASVSQIFLIGNFFPSDFEVNEKQHSAFILEMAFINLFIFCCFMKDALKN